MDALLISQYVLSGVVIGIIYSLMALGITFIYGIMKMINWSMGEFFMIGSYVQYALLASVLFRRCRQVVLVAAIIDGVVDWATRNGNADDDTKRVGLVTYVLLKRLDDIADTVRGRGGGDTGDLALIVTNGPDCQHRICAVHGHQRCLQVPLRYFTALGPLH